MLAFASNRAFDSAFVLTVVAVASLPCPSASKGDYCFTTVGGLRHLSNVPYSLGRFTAASHRLMRLYLAVLILGCSARRKPFPVSLCFVASRVSAVPKDPLHLTRSASLLIGFARLLSARDSVC